MTNVIFVSELPTCLFHFKCLLIYCLNFQYRKLQTTQHKDTSLMGLHYPT